ncbi:kinase-like domain-containing protein [Umbelopsis sp. AD052]|nr:kinase-like domain-containing protein [Umbelopsis sp. AD052]
MRKTLPTSKIMDLNPREQYTGFTKIGSGANGAVVRASKRSNSKSRVAIKRCFIDDTDAPHLAYILREIRIMGCISHANLVGLKEATLWGDYVWLAMDLMSCSVFGLLCNISTGLPEPLAVCVLRECLQGLIHLHNKGYMHRDVKCENLLLSSSGEVKLGDFGLATPISRNNTARLGTAKWMSPEVIREISYDEKVDVWSTAITLIEIMDRVPPLYYMENTDDIFAEILWGPPPHFTFASPSNTIREIATWMLNQDSRRRPGAKDVLQHLDRQIQDGYLQCASQSDLALFVQHVFDKSTD